MQAVTENLRYKEDWHVRWNGYAECEERRVQVLHELKKLRKEGRAEKADEVAWNRSMQSLYENAQPWR